MRKKYTTAFIGASAWTVGYISAHSDENSVIIEPTAILSPEFAGAFRAEPISKPTTLQGEDFSRDLVTRNLLLPDGRISIPAINPYFARVLLASNAVTLLMTHVYEIIREENGFVVRYVNTDGYGELFCERIVDTRSVRGGKATLRAMLGGHGCPIDGYSRDGIYVLHGRFDDEYILAMEVQNDADDSYADDTDNGPAVRAMYREKWAELCHTDFAGWETVTIAPFLAREYPSPICQKISEEEYVCPSASYPDVMAAYEGGVRCVL